MVDTVWLYGQDSPIRNTGRLTPKGSFISEHGQQTYRALLGNMIITHNSERSKCRGSLPKLIQGNNISPFSYEAMVNGFYELGNILDVPIETYRIQRLDLSILLPVEDYVKSYFRHITHSTRKERRRKRSTLYFENGIKTLVIYDKVKELKDRREKVPLEYQTGNFMKIELRLETPFLKRWSEKILKRPLVVNDLLTPKTFRKLFSLLEKEIDQLTWMNPVEIDISQITYKTFETWLIAQQAEIIGIPECIELVENLKYSPNRKSANVQRCSSKRKFLKKIQSLPTLPTYQKKEQSFYNTLHAELSTALNSIIPLKTNLSNLSI